MAPNAFSDRLIESNMQPFTELPQHNLFFELADPLKNPPFRLRSRLPAESLPDRKQLDLHAQGANELSVRFQFDAVQGNKAEDFLWTQLVRPACVSGRVVKLLEVNEISGWSTFPVEVYDPDGILIPDFHGLAVTGPSYRAEHNRSEIVQMPPLVQGGKSFEIYRGLFFDESLWDGTDMFWVDRVHVVTERTCRLFQEHKVGNVQFTPLEERETRVRHVKRD